MVGVEGAVKQVQFVCGGGKCERMCPATLRHALGVEVMTQL